MASVWHCERCRLKAPAGPVGPDTRDLVAFPSRPPPLHPITPRPPPSSSPSQFPPALSDTLTVLVSVPASLSLPERNERTVHTQSVSLRHREMKELYTPSQSLSLPQRNERTVHTQSVSLCHREMKELYTPSQPLSLPQRNERTVHTQSVSLSATEK